MAASRWLSLVDQFVSMKASPATLLLIAAGVAGSIAWLLLLIAIGIESWTIHAARTTSSPLGSVSIRHDVGVFRTKIRECCLVSGQFVADFGVVCNTAPPHDGCATFFETTGSYCDYTDEKQRRSASGSADCGAVEGGSIATAILVIVALVMPVAAAVAVMLRAAHAGTVALTSGVCCACCIVSLILVEVLISKNVEEYLQSRYATSAPNNATFSGTSGDSFKLLAASLAFFLVTTLLAAASWYLKPRPVTIVREPTPEVEHVMTPERQNPVTRMATSAPSQELPLCPIDTECEYIDDFGHQLQHAHTCRVPFCTDTSSAHRRHFVHF